MNLVIWGKITVAPNVLTRQAILVTWAENMPFILWFT